MSKKIKQLDGQGMRDLANIIKTFAPGIGFALITFPLNGNSDQLMNYISNGQREDMIHALKELLAKWESGTDYMTPNNN
jgi:hypothetical protein